MYLCSSHLSRYKIPSPVKRNNKNLRVTSVSTLEYGPAIELFPSRSNTLYVILYAFPRRARESFSVP